MEISTLSSSDDHDEHVVVETDPTGRFERYKKCLGMGAYKRVSRFCLDVSTLYINIGDLGLSGRGYRRRNGSSLE